MPEDPDALHYRVTVAHSRDSVIIPFGAVDITDDLLAFTGGTVPDEADDNPFVTVPETLD